MLNAINKVTLDLTNRINFKCFRLNSKKRRSYFSIFMVEFFFFSNWMFYEVFLDNAIKGGLVIGSRFILNLEFPQSVWHKNNPTETVKSTKWREPQKWHFTRFYRWKFMNSISKRLKVKNRKDEKTVYHKNWQISIEDA